jgi:hypothetical protein
MAHTCEDCGETFETLSSLRLHDCPEDEDDAEGVERNSVEDHMAGIRKQEHKEDTAAKRDASEELTGPTEWANYEEGSYWGFHRVFYGPAVEALETAVQDQGWPFLLDILEAYWPEVTLDFESYPDHEAFQRDELSEFEDYPHVSHVLTTVTGQHMVRTRRAAGVGAIPPDALAYLLLFHRHPGDSGAWIESMSYGWGIGHPAHAVDDTLRTLVVGEYEIWASTALEHAMHADADAATTLLEDLFAAEIVSDPGLLLRGLGSIDRGQYPDTSEHWQWETLDPEFDDEPFDWDPEIQDRLRRLVEDCGLVQQLPDDWTFADIVI